MADPPDQLKIAADTTAIKDAVNKYPENLINKEIRHIMNFPVQNENGTGRTAGTQRIEMWNQKEISGSAILYHSLLLQSVF